MANDEYQSIYSGEEIDAILAMAESGSNEKNDKKIEEKLAETVGNLESLETENKSNVVEAINSLIPRTIRDIKIETEEEYDNVVDSGIYYVNVSNYEDAGGNDTLSQALLIVTAEDDDVAGASVTQIRIKDGKTEFRSSIEAGISIDIQMGVPSAGIPSKSITHITDVSWGVWETMATSADTGNKDNLATTDKSNLVAAINELAGTAVKKITKATGHFSDVDYDALTEPGIYKLHEAWENGMNPPTVGYIVVTGDTMWGEQFLITGNASGLRHRSRISGFWKSWETIGRFPVQHILFSEIEGRFYPQNPDAPYVKPLKGNTYIALPDTTFEGTTPLIDIEGHSTHEIRIPSLSNSGEALEHPVPGWFKANVPVRLMFNGECWLAVDYAGAAEAGIPGEEYGYGAHASETCQAGIKGYYWYDMDFTSQHDVGITLTKEQNVAPAKTFDIPWKEGDIVSIVNGSKYVDCAQIVYVYKNTIVVSLPPFSEVAPVTEWDIDDRTIYVAAKPDKGEVELGHFAVATGEDTKAIERASVAMNKGTKAKGQYSVAQNKNTIAYYACHAEGIDTIAGTPDSEGIAAHAQNRGTRAYGAYSDAGNQDTIAEAIGAFVRGYMTKARKGANYSDVGGIENEATMPAQFIRGAYAIIDVAKQYLEIMGNGTSKDNRKNIRTLDWNGNEWLAGTLLLGAGRYDVGAYLKNALTLLQWEKKTIAAEEYKGCAELTIADFPYTTEVGRMAFGQCTGLKVANFKSLTTIGQYGFWMCTSLISADLPSIDTVGSQAFAEDYALKDVNVPKATIIGYQSFYKCRSIEALDLPKTKTIYAQAFYSCSSLASLILRNNEVCTLENVNAFSGTPVEKGTGFIYVPDALVDSYKSAANWSTFAAQIKGISELEG